MHCVFAKIVYTGKSVIQNSYLIFSGTRIVGISKGKKGTLLGKFDVVTPVFIDPHSHIGMVRSGEPEEEGETNEQMESITPLPDALDSVQMDDAAFKQAIEMGVLYSCVMPGSGNIIAGHCAVIRNYAKNSTEAFIAPAGVKAAFGYNSMAAQEWKGWRPSTRMGAVSLLRMKLDEIQQKMAKYKKARINRI